jgi:hypothetical protein
MIQVIEKDFGLVRELAKGEGATIHEPLDVTRGETSHQMGRGVYIGELIGAWLEWGRGVCFWKWDAKNSIRVSEAGLAMQR